METTFGFSKRSFLVFLLLLIPFQVAHCAATANSATTSAATPSVGAADVTSTLMIGGSRIDVTIDASEAPVSEVDVMKWVQSAAESVAAYYGRFPVPHLTLRIMSVEGTGVRHGMTWGRGGGLIRISAGGKTSAAEFAEDWMLTHEMIHLAFPSQADEHHWIEEGLSVYVEPIARIRAGHWTALKMWSDLVRDMPKGEPQAGDAGMDHTHTWGRTYWGGALFAFVADVQIRKQTNNRKGLEDALRAILDAGGTINEDWALEKAFKIGDEAVGLDVLEKLYAEWKDKPMQVDLPAMWKQLGVEANGATVVLKDDAPMAAIRRGIETGNARIKMDDGAAPSKKDPGSSARPLAVFVGRTARSN
jgi:hypothetical protein